jgi:alanine or glycine:cation symporter, AGCS family
MESCVSRLIRLSCLVALIFTFAPAPALFAETNELITAPLNTLAQEAELSGLEKAADDFLGGINAKLAAVFFWDVWFWDNGQEGETKLPFTVAWLVLGAIYFTLRMGFVQFRLFSHAIKITKGDFDNPDDEGEVSHFQALTTALSATVGLGNIAGVAIAISIGGPGATVWMILAGLLGMASKFTECSLGQMYRETRSDGSVMGGAMYYLSNGLKEMGMGALGKGLAIMFALLCIGGSFGGGGSFQVNQSLNALQETVPFLGENRWVYGAIMTICVALVIIGGLKRIAQTAEKIVPAMCGIYVAASLAVILMNVGEVPAAIGKIISGAMNPAAGLGGFIGVLVTGFKRAAFSNEAGIGSAAIAHSAAKTPYAVREGIVSLLEPFIDTVVVCTMTALVIVVTGAYDGSNPTFAPYIESANGAGLTSVAFAQSIPWFPYVLSVAVVLFAFSTIISWSYYGERCWSWLFGDGSGFIYRIIFLTFIFGGSVVTAGQVLDFGDLMILGMALPNILGVLFLSGKVKAALTDYEGKLNAGEFKEFKA